MKKLRATKRSLLDVLVEWWLELKDTFLAWWSPSSVYVGPVDDEPRIPYAEWFKLVKEGLVDPKHPPESKDIKWDETAGYMPTPPPIPMRKAGSCIRFW